MPIMSRRCLSCRNVYEILAVGWDPKGQAFRSVTALDREDIDNLACPSCDDVGYEAVPSVGKAPLLPSAHGTMYPYFDRGLGIELRSEAHRRQVCRERGLTPMEGTVQDYQDAAERERYRREEFDREVAEDARRQQADPEIRKAQDVISKMAAEKRLHELFQGVDRKKTRVDSSY